jgi:hypothetical protein
VFSALQCNVLNIVQDWMLGSGQLGSFSGRSESSAAWIRIQGHSIGGNTGGFLTLGLTFLFRLKDV